MERAELLLVVNKAAARARAVLPRVKKALEDGGVRFDAREPSGPGETEEATRAAISEGFRTVAVVGGDGTLSAAASGYFTSFKTLAEGESPRAVNPTAALAIIPAGTGDDFARGISGGRREPLDAWLARLVKHCRAESGAQHQSESLQSVDVLLGSVGGGARRFLCINAATIGIGAEVASRVAAQGATVRRLSGEARFALAAVRSLAAWRNRRVRVRIDDAGWEECETNLLAVVNGAYAGGGMNFSPKASLTDGLLDVLTVRGLSRAALVRELTRVHRGGHLANPKVTLSLGTRVRVETVDAADALGIEADGDPRGQTPAELRVMPAALRVIV